MTDFKQHAIIKLASSTNKELLENHLDNIWESIFNIFISYTGNNLPIRKKKLMKEVTCILKTTGNYVFLSKENQKQHLRFLAFYKD